GDYITAESNLNQFITTFPLSPFTEEAKFLRLDCLYRGTYRYELDPLPTRRALAEMSVFQVENPKSQYHARIDEMMDDLNNRLELKAYKAAYLYYHMEDYLAAHYALKNVLKENAENRYREEILYYTALSAYKYAFYSVAAKQRERYLIFVDDYFNIVSEYPESKYLKELEGLYNKAQKQLKKDNPNG
ncbi:MAG: outer membrane protein assembly factor BamD, partial [Bacteroidales bacterium]|nr:outer membrane protein assembly factor BamD [Bacteroidales bacterium]